MIHLKEVQNNKELKKFVKFPFELYKDSPYWVPPLIKEEMEQFQEDKNPVFKTAQAQYFLAYKEGKIVGRIAAIINWIEINEQKVSKMRFGWFDFIDDDQVSKTLLDKVYEIGKANGLSYMEGPVGFSNLDKVGVLVDGFDSIGTMITWYNHPYYVEHYKKYGFTVEKQFEENRFPFSNIDNSKFEKLSNILGHRLGLEVKNFHTTKDLLPYVDQMFDLFNESYSVLSSFVPITQVQKEYLTNKFISFINPEYIKFVFTKEGKMVCFAITMPSFSKALQKARGKLFPFGFYHLLKAKNNNPDAIFYLIGVHPSYQNKGVTAMLFNHFYKSFEKIGVVNCVRTPELTNNLAIKKLWTEFKPEVYKKRNTFKKDIQ